MRFAAPLIGVLAAIAIVAGVPADAQAQKPIAFGAYTPGAPDNRSTIDAFNDRVGRRAVMWLTYKNFSQEPFARTTMDGATSSGALPLVTWEPFGRSLAGIARGDYDGYIRNSARQAAAYGKPILLRFAHEMNGGWYDWGRQPAAYVSAWRHVVRIFRAENASNVKHVWAPNVGSFDSYWPGDEWVDFLGLDGYNWGAKYNNWESFEEVFDSSYRAIVKLSRKPIIITEFAANEAGGDKPAWIRHAFSSAVANRYPQIRGLVWFDQNKETDWRVNSSSATLSAFRTAMNQSLLNLDAAGLFGLSGTDSAGPTPAPPSNPIPTTPPSDPAPPAPAGGKLRCGIYPRGTLRASRTWTVNIPIRCNRAAPDGCYGVVKIKHVGSRRTLGTARVELWPGRRNAVRVGLPGWARTSLDVRSSVATRVTMRAGSGCTAGPGRRVTLRR